MTDMESQLSGQRATGRRSLLTIGTPLLYLAAAVLIVMAVRDRLATHHTPISLAGVDDAAIADTTGAAAAFVRAASEGIRSGPSDAQVAVVVYSNYGCGHCAEFDSTLRELRQRFPDEVAVIMKHFAPADQRPIFAVHEAAQCANDQHMFEQFTDVWFRSGSSDRNREPWRDVGRRIGIPDQQMFVFCVRSNRHASEIERDTKEGTAMGVVGTPTSFVNGVKVVGAIPFVGLERLVATELGRGSRRAD